MYAQSLGIGIEADEAGIGIPASCISVRYGSILKKKQDGAAWHFLGVLRHSRRVLAFWTPGIPGALISCLNLKVHKIEIFFGFDFEICNISLIIRSKY